MFWFFGLGWNYCLLIVSYYLITFIFPVWFVSISNYYIAPSILDQIVVYLPKVSSCPFPNVGYQVFQAQNFSILGVLPTFVLGACCFASYFCFVFLHRIYSHSSFTRSYARNYLYCFSWHTSICSTSAYCNSSFSAFTSTALTCSPKLVFLPRVRPRYFTIFFMLIVLFPVCSVTSLSVLLPYNITASIFASVSFTSILSMALATTPIAWFAFCVMSSVLFSS